MLGAGGRRMKLDLTNDDEVVTNQGMFVAAAPSPASSFLCGVWMGFCDLELFEFALDRSWLAGWRLA